LDKELKRIFPHDNNLYVYPIHEYTELKPTIRLDISNISFNELRNQCEENFKICKAKLKKSEEERNKPLNRLKRFFNF